jgi:tetratricopeptide (TPR) repeat protein
VIALISMVFAVQLDAEMVPCPLGEGQAKVYHRISENAVGGYDSDFATYGSGGQWREYSIATCMPSLLTLYGSDMVLPIPEGKKAAVQAALNRVVGALPNREDPQLWERYGIAAAVYEALGKDEMFLGNLWMQASWTARDAAVGLYNGLSGPQTARKLLDGGVEELKKNLSVVDRKNVLYNLARVAQRGGWSSERDGYLANFEALGLDSREKTALARFRELSQKVEPDLQEKALAQYRAALRKGGLGEEELRVRYLCADLARRLGRFPEAKADFEAVVAGEAPEELKELSRFFLGLGR